MLIIAWLVLGMLTGLAANRIMALAKPTQIADILSDTALGVFGALFGGFVFSVVGGRALMEWSLWSLPCAAMGALLMLGGVHALRRTGLGFR